MCEGSLGLVQFIMLDNCSDFEHHSAITKPLLSRECFPHTFRVFVCVNRECGRPTEMDPFSPSAWHSTASDFERFGWMNPNFAAADVNVAVGFLFYPFGELYDLPSSVFLLAELEMLLWRFIFYCCFIWGFNFECGICSILEFYYM